MRNKITNDQIKFIIDNYAENGLVYCANKLNLPKGTIATIARRNLIKVNRDVVLKNMSKDVINIDDYINVSSREISYILGLIWTDGHVSFANNKTKTPIVKHSCVFYDSDNSDRIFKYLNWRRFESENKKSIGGNRMVVNWISSRILGEYLIAHNYRDKKKGTFIYRNFENLTSHFLRGVLDGDGCITISKSNKNYKQTAIYFSSEKEQDWSFLTNIFDKIGVSYKIRKIKDSIGESSQICT